MCVRISEMYTVHCTPRLSTAVVWWMMNESKELCRVHPYHQCCLYISCILFFVISSSAFLPQARCGAHASICIIPHLKTNSCFLQYALLCILFWFHYLKYSLDDASWSQIKIFLHYIKQFFFWFLGGTVTKYCDWKRFCYSNSIWDLKEWI